MRLGMVGLRKRRSTHYVVEVVGGMVDPPARCPISYNDEAILS